MIIRTEQMRVFEQNATETSEERLLEHVRTYWPLHWRMIGQEQLRLVVQLGKERAAKYGLEAERERCLYLSVMLALGSYFDEDVQVPWAAQLLEPDGQADNFSRVQRVYRRAMEHLETVHGRDGAALRAAAGRFGAVGAINAAEIPRALALAFPEKQIANEAVVQYAAERCREYGMTTLGGVFLYAGTIRFLGQRFDKDPQFPWAKQVLSETGVSPDQKTLRFRDEGLRQRELWMRAGGA